MDVVFWIWGSFVGLFSVFVLLLLWRTNKELNRYTKRMIEIAEDPEERARVNEAHDKFVKELTQHFMKKYKEKP